MADNVTLNPGTGGVVVAADEVSTLNGAGSSGVQVQRVKVMFGDDNTARDASASFPLPVDTELPAAAALADATANPTTTSLGAHLMGWNGSTWDRARAGIDASTTAQNLVMTNTANAVTLSGLNSASTLGVQVTGTWTGTMIVEATIDGTNWFSVPILSFAGILTVAGTTTANGQWQAEVGGIAQARARCSITGSGTAVVSLRSSVAAGLIGLDAPLPAGTNNIGGVNVAQLAGTTTDTNSGNKSAGTLRVVVATDQPNLTTPLNTNVAQINGVATTMGNGVSGTGVLRVTVASDSTGQINTLGNIVDNAAFTDGTTRLQMSGFIFDETAGTALTENDAAAGRVDSKRAQVGVIEDATTRGQRASVNSSTGLSVTPVPHTAGGLSISRVISAASTNATSAKGSAGMVYTIIAHNINAAVRYLKLYNKASAPTVGTDTPVLTLPIPANTAGAGFVLDTGGMGISFATGIALAITTGVADADTAAVAANEIVVNVLYK